MQFDGDACYRAVQSRDRRFDGRFFTAVRTTRIFCRPICPAPTPKRENVTFYPTAAAAAMAGYRPCLRCRPEAAPTSLAFNGTLNTVTRALRMLESGYSDGLADRLGVSDRHLRRLFHQHIGASPRDVEITGRVLLAKSLISGTALPLTEVAFAAGFSSIRRFNDAMQKVYRCTPTEIRRQAATIKNSTVCLNLGFVPPYDWTRFRTFVKSRLIPGLEMLEEDTLTRRLSIGKCDVMIRAQYMPETTSFRIELELSNLNCLREVVERARTFFDLRCVPEQVRKHLAPSIRIPPGLRVPGSWDRFETCVRAVLGQQISVKAATTFAARLCERFNGFPQPEDLATGSLAGLGLTTSRTETLRRMSAAIAEGRIKLDTPENIQKLTEIRGIGCWTTEYIALRCGEPDAFPSGDLALKHYQDTDAWRPWRSYAAMSIWMKEVQ
jgi:AraC family transcriptional regulator, regulatory protein of adaptative response / DNA-3-methyladenine glycosylase II